MSDNDHHMAVGDESDSDLESDLDEPFEALSKLPSVDIMEDIGDTGDSGNTGMDEDSGNSLDVEEMIHIPLPATLTFLRQMLLGDYKCPQSPPNFHPAFQDLTPVERLSLKHYVAWKMSNGTVKAYKMHAAVLKDATGLNILSLYNCQKLAIKLTKLEAYKVDICPNSCVAYAGSYENEKYCPYVKDGKTCGLPQYRQKHKPNAQMMCLPIMATIKAMFANADTAALLRYRDTCLKQALHLVGTTIQKFSDFGNAKVHKEHYCRGLFKDPRDIAFAISTDGAQLTMKKHSNTWIVIIIL